MVSRRVDRPSAEAGSAPPETAAGVRAAAAEEIPRRGGEGPLGRGPKTPSRRGGGESPGSGPEESPGHGGDRPPARGSALACAEALSGAAAGRRGRAGAGGLWVLPPVVALGLVFLYPLALVVWQSFTPEDGGGQSAAAYGEVFGEASFQGALGNTVLIAAGATVGSLALGFVLALVIAFVPFPGGKALSRFIDVFLAFPSFLITLALLFVYGTVGMANGLWTGVTGAASGPLDFLRTPWGVLLAEITYFTPFVMRPLLAAFSQVETAQLEVASSLGARPWRVVRTVILPEALPALAAGGALVLVMGLNEFGIVLFTGAKDVVTLPMLVYSKAILDGDYTGACVVAVVNIALSVALYALYRAAVSRTRGGGVCRAGA